MGEHGLFLIYEAASPDGEIRADWLRRWDAQRPWWTAYDDAGWHAVAAHAHADDFPETDTGWRALSHEAGVGRVELLFTAPADMPHMSCFRA